MCVKHIADALREEIFRSPPEGGLKGALKQRGARANSHPPKSTTAADPEIGRRACGPWWGRWDRAGAAKFV
jgi:hypothetical protein